ncbi:MAG: hypothetical protein OWS74_04125, partial [Firmicutes bacterium]|nr:hypothetical protein [Bacillota bacterium]
IIGIGFVVWLSAGAVWPHTIPRPSRQDWIGSLWFIAFLTALGVLSYYGPATFDAPANHGHGVLSLWTANGLVALTGLIFYGLGIFSGWKTPTLMRHLARYHAQKNG